MGGNCSNCCGPDSHNIDTGNNVNVAGHHGNPVSILANYLSKSLYDSPFVRYIADHKAGTF